MATMSVTTATRYTFAIGSKNPAKISAVQKAVAKLFANPPATSDLKNIAAILPVETMTTEAKSAPATTQPASTVDANDTCHKFIGVDVSSGVAAQPLDISVTTKGAIQRAKATLAAVPDADFAIGIESGLENVRWLSSLHSSLPTHSQSFIFLSVYSVQRIIYHPALPFFESSLLYHV